MQNRPAQAGAKGNAAWRRLYPFESHYLELAALQYHYLDEGDGPPLLMVHGNPTWSFYWRRLVTAFRGERRVIVPDHIGCGLSDKPQDYPYRLSQHIDNLVRLIQRLDLTQATLIAHDWGGAIGLGAVLAEPSRFSKFVLLNTGAFPPHYVPWRIRACRTPLLGRWAVRRLNVFARAALFMAVHKRRRMTAAERAGLLAPYDNWAHRVAIHQFVCDIPLSPRHPTWRTLAEIESGLQQLADRPVQLIWGTRDWCFTEACLERFQSLFPHADTHRLEDAGHYVVEDAHERIVPLVAEFLERHQENST